MFVYSFQFEVYDAWVFNGEVRRIFKKEVNLLEGGKGVCEKRRQLMMEEGTSPLMRIEFVCKREHKWLSMELCLKMEEIGLVLEVPWLHLFDNNEII